MNVIKVVCICFMAVLVGRAEAKIKDLDLMPYTELSEADAITKFDADYKDSIILSVKSVDYFFSDHKYTFIKNLVTKHHVSPKGFLEYINLVYGNFVCGNDVHYRKVKSPTCMASIVYAPNQFTAAKLDIAQFLKDAGDVPTSFSFSSCIWKNELELLKFFVAMNGGKLPSKEEGENMMVDACTAGNISMVQYLLEIGVSPDSKDQYPIYAIYKAVSYPDIFFLLIDKGADYNIVGFQSTTPILHAAREGCLETLQFFVDKKVDPYELHGKLSAMTMAKLYNKKNSSAVISLLKKIK